MGELKLYHVQMELDICSLDEYVVAQNEEQARDIAYGYVGKGYDKKDISVEEVIAEGYKIQLIKSKE